MNIILLGPPGLGKGTQARLLASDLKALHISSGDLLRRAAQDPSGGDLARSLDDGGLIDDETVTRLVADALARDSAAGGWILDGYPRTLIQAKDLDALAARAGMSIDRVILLTGNDDEVVRRVVSRRVCSACGAITSTEKVDDRCVRCGGELVRRGDDTSDVVRRRLEVYRVEAPPVIGHYESAGRLARIDGMRSIGAVHTDILSVLRKGERWTWNNM